MANKATELFRNRIVGYDTKPADQFTANPLNYRKHPQRQRDAVNASLRELGWISTVVENVTTGNVIDGHERIWQALQHNEDVPYLKVELSEAEERLALAVFDPITNMAETDAAILDDLLREVNTGEAALQQLLAELATDAGLYGDKGTEGDTPAEVDRAEELRQKWGTCAGQLWELGAHKLICGDCTDAATVARVMGGERAQAVVTDPPYGTASESKVQKRGDRIETFDIAWDKDAPLEWIPLLRDCLDDGAAVISFWENAGITTLWTALEANGFNPLHTVYWKKTTVPQPRPNFCSSIESAVFARKQGKVLCWNGGGATPNVFEANRAAGNERTAHETQKPLTLFLWLVELVTNDGFIVYEPFSGSGTTIIACENLGRRCRAVEISPAYVAVALERFSQHTGKTPVLIP